MAVAKCTQNLVVPKLIPIITYAVTLFVSLTESRLKTETVMGHRELVNAIENHDGDRAEKVMTQHIEYNRALLEEIIANLKNEDTKEGSLQEKREMI